MAVPVLLLLPSDPPLLRGVWKDDMICFVLFFSPKRESRREIAYDLL